MRRKIFLGILGVTSLLLGGFLAVLQFWLNSPEFQKGLVDEVARQTGCQVRVERIRIRFGRGLDFEGFQVSNPQFHPQDFLQAERLRINFNFFNALVHGKIVLEEIKLTRPVIQLDLSHLSRAQSRESLPLPQKQPERQLPEKDPKDGGGNKVSPSSNPSPPSLPPRKSPLPNPSPSKLSHSPPSFDLKRLVVEDGSLLMTLPDGEKLVLQGVKTRASFSTQPVAGIMGNMACASAEFPHHHEASDLKLDFLWRGDGLEIPGFSVKIWGGAISGNFKADFSGEDLPFELSLTSQGVNMASLLNTAGVEHPLFEGQLLAQTKLKGFLVNPLQTNGSGQAKILNGRFAHLPPPTLAALSVFLGRWGLQEIPLQKCEVDFLLQNGTLQIPRFQALSTDMELSGQGWVKLKEETQEFQIKFALSQDIIKRFPELSSKMAQRADGCWEGPFRTWGTLDAPQSDFEDGYIHPILTRLQGNAVIERIYQGMEHLMPSTTNQPEKAEGEK